MTKKFYLWVNMTVEAETENDAFDYAYEAMHLAEGQGLMEHRSEVLKSWSIEAPTEQMFTTCDKCGLMNVPVIDDGGEGAAAELCEKCDE